MTDAAQPVSQPERVPTGHFVFVGIVCLFWAVTGIGPLQTAYHHDFLNLYTGSSLAREGRFTELYDINTQLSRERELLGEVAELVPFVRPHFYALLLAPLSLLPYDAAFWFWIVLQTALLVACWVWARRRFGPDALIFCCLYFPTVGGILVGQDCIFLTVILIVASVFAERWEGLLERRRSRPGAVQVPSSTASANRDGAPPKMEVVRGLRGQRGSLGPAVSPARRFRGSRTVHTPFAGGRLARVGSGATEHDQHLRFRC